MKSFLPVLWPILLQAAAFGVAMAEIVLPSFGLLFVLCVGLIAYSWFLIVTTLSGGALVGFLIADALLIPLGFWLGIRLLGRSPLSHRSDVGQGTGLEADDEKLSRHIGSVATVDAMLRPAGKVALDGEVYEGITAGDFIEKGATVKVVGLKSGALLVERENAVV
jgi:membrane-bound ClpP family serine protease